MRNRTVLAVVFLFCCALPALGADNAYLYRVSLVQAAPGKLLDLIDLMKAHSAALQAAGDEAPLWMRTARATTGT